MTDTTSKEADEEYSDDQPDKIVRHVSTGDSSSDDIKLTTKVKRGTGTRDQDTVKVKVTGDEPASTVGKLDEVLSEIDQRGLADDLRDVNPER